MKSWTSKSALRTIAWKCVMIMPCILLQKPSKQSKSKDHYEALKRRLQKWKKGNTAELYKECLVIQKRLKSPTLPNSMEATSKKFAVLMRKGNVSAAIKFLTDNMEGGVLPLNDKTMLLL